jgi:glycosyltransferase involved in cell wall biosynthesis
MDYDLVHFHWIYYDVISIEDISKIKKPIVWTMHDSWVFCGAEYHPNVLENDSRFIYGYKKSNKPKTTTGPDICRKTWQRKVRSWKKVKFQFISPSNFEKELLQKSLLLKNADCVVIPNIIPNRFFRQLDKNQIRNLYNIPLTKRILGFGAVSINSNKSIKGEFLLIEALMKLKNKDDFYLVVFGDSSDNSIFSNLQIPTFIAGMITNPYILTTVYNLCDVFICPSLVENLPNVCLEASFCGIPVAAFNTGGIPDIVEHKKTGYLAKPFNTDDLATGIQHCIKNYTELSKNSIIKANRDFNTDVIITKHLELYKQVIDNKNSSYLGRY